MSKNQLVLAYFENEEAADAAVSSLKSWDKASKEIKLGALGVLVKDDKGKVKTHKVGKRNTALGVLLGAIAAVLSGGLALLGGVVGGGLIGSIFHKGLGISKEDMAAIDAKLTDGKAAVGVLAKPDEAQDVSAKMTELGGEVEAYDITDDAVEQAETVAAEPETVAAEPETDATPAE